MVTTTVSSWAVSLLLLLSVVVCVVDGQSIQTGGATAVIGSNAGLQVEVDVDYEIRSKTPSNTMAEVDDQLFTYLYRAITDHDGDKVGTLIINTVTSTTTGDCLDDAGLSMESNNACTAAQCKIIATMARPQFDPEITRQGLYEIANRFFKDYTADYENNTGNTGTYLTRMAYPISVTTSLRIGFREFDPIINENERNVISTAVYKTMKPIMLNSGNPIYDLQYVSVIVQDVRKEDLFLKKEDERRRHLEGQDPVILWTDLFIRGHCHITEPRCTNYMFNETLYERMFARDPNNEGLTGLEILLQDLKYEGEEAGTAYFTKLHSTIVVSTVHDNYYLNVDIDDEAKLLEFNYRDPDDYDKKIPIWLWLFLLASISILVIGIPALFCAQRTWEASNKKKKADREERKREREEYN